MSKYAAPRAPRGSVRNGPVASRRGRSVVVDSTGRRRLTRSEKLGVAGVATLAGIAILGVVAGVLLDRLLDFDDALDAGGEWDEGGGVHTRWQ